jgi:dTMP kinase
MWTVSEEKRTGVFIALEGGEGSGKDTQIDILKKKMDPETTIFTREPGGTSLGEEIRALILKERTPNMCPETELLLFLAARAEIMEQIVRPALRAGKTVISNRFGLSTIAYQIYGRERPELLPLLQKLSDAIVGVDKPHYILLDISPETGKERVEARGALSRFDADSLAFHARVQEGYRMHVHDGISSVVVDASKQVDDVSKDVWKAVSLWI